MQDLLISIPLLIQRVTSADDSMLYKLCSTCFLFFFFFSPLCFSFLKVEETEAVPQGSDTSCSCGLSFLSCAASLYNINQVKHLCGI